MNEDWDSWLSEITGRYDCSGHVVMAETMNRMIKAIDDANAAIEAENAHWDGMGNRIPATPIALLPSVPEELVVPSREELALRGRRLLAAAAAL